MISEVWVVKLKNIARLLNCVQKGGEFIVSPYDISVFATLISYEQCSQIKELE